MGIRWVERRLAPELCYEAVAQAVHEYLEECREAGELLSPFDHLVAPIIRAGFYPPGLHCGKALVDRYRYGEVARTEARCGGEEQGDIHLPDEAELIEEIMRPYPVRRLRAYWRRTWREIHEYELAEERHRRDAAECNTMQHLDKESLS